MQKWDKQTMKDFSLIQKIRNKIKVSKSSSLYISDKSKIVGCYIYIKGQNNKLTIDDNTTLRNTKIEIIGNNCEIFIGKECMIGDNSYLSAKEETKLIIKDGCGFSRNIKIMTSDGHPIYKNNIRINPAKDIMIEDKVWIADNVTVLKGVKIGQGSVIGINSTVTKDIPANCIAAGNPSKVINTDILWQD